MIAVRYIQYHDNLKLMKISFGISKVFAGTLFGLICLYSYVSGDAALYVSMVWCLNNTKGTIVSWKVDLDRKVRS
jgi:hypothetical protein